MYGLSVLLNHLNKEWGGFYYHRNRLCENNLQWVQQLSSAAIELSVTRLLAPYWPLNWTPLILCHHNCIMKMQGLCIFGCGPRGVIFSKMHDSLQRPRSWKPLAEWYKNGHCFRSDQYCLSKSECKYLCRIRLSILLLDEW